MLGLTLAGRWAVGRYAIAAWMAGHTPVIRRRGIALDGVRAFEPWLQDLPDAVAVSDLPDSPLAETLRSQGARLLLRIRTASVRGFAALGARVGGRGFDEGTEFGAALAAQAAVAFENAWRLRETLARRKAEQELALAAAIQRGLFPAELPSLPGIRLAAYYRPASQVGGDYYDAMPAEGGAQAPDCLLCVADVSGKGLPAALLMSTIQATLRALHVRTRSLVDLVAETSELLFASTPGNKYATAILARLELGTGELTYVNAGHARCLLVRGDGQAEALEPCGPPIGLLPGMGWEERRLTLGAGDTLALFSDGVTEAWNAAEEEFGEDRIVQVLRATTSGTAAECVDRLVAAIDAFAGSAAQHDDITLMIAK